MSRDDRMNVMNRLQRLSPADQEAVLWRALGGIEYQAEVRPQARIGEVFAILESHLLIFEAARLDAMDARMFGHHTCPA